MASVSSGLIYWQLSADRCPANQAPLGDPSSQVRPASLFAARASRSLALSLLFLHAGLCAKPSCRGTMAARRIIGDVRASLFHVSALSPINLAHAPRAAHSHTLARHTRNDVYMLQSPMVFEYKKRARTLTLAVCLDIRFRVGLVVFPYTARERASLSGNRHFRESGFVCFSGRTKGESEDLGIECIGVVPC